MDEDTKIQVQLANLDTRLKNIEKIIEEIKDEHKASNDSLNEVIDGITRKVNEITNKLIANTTKNQDQIDELRRQFQEISESNLREAQRLRNIILVLIPLLASTATTLIIEAISLFHI